MQNCKNINIYVEPTRTKYVVVFHQETSRNVVGFYL